MCYSKSAKASPDRIITPTKLINQLFLFQGPLVCFESLLSLYGGETPMFNDMIVVVEDLRNVEFNLILVDKRSKFRLKNKSSGSSSNSNHGSSGSNNNFSQQSQQKSSPSVPILEYHSFPLPRITGSRSSLKVSQGVIHRYTYIVGSLVSNVKNCVIIRSFHEIFVLFSRTHTKKIFFFSI